MPEPIAFGQVPINTSVKASASAGDTARIRDAAEQFEALLVAQLLRSARESSGGWLGSGDDAASGCAFDMADGQLELAMAKRGGLGLAGLIASGLGPKT